MPPTPRRRWSAALAASAVVLLPLPQRPSSAPEGGKRSDLALTVYSTADPASFDPKQAAQSGQASAPYQLPGYGVVRETRTIALEKGLNTVRFADVAVGIDPTTVSFASLTDPGGTAV